MEWGKEWKKGRRSGRMRRKDEKERGVLLYFLDPQTF
jgi:hypothetical protein